MIRYISPSSATLSKASKDRKVKIMANSNQLTAQQRAALFGASTRQHWQMIGKQEVTGGAQTIQFRVPKARILRGMKLWI